MENEILHAELDENVTRITQTLRGTSSILSEALFELSEEGIHCQAADPAMVGLVHFDWKEAVFDDYSYSGEDGKLVGINVELLYRAFKKANKSDKVLLKYGETEDGMRWKVEVITDDFTTQKFLMSLDLKEEGIPTVDQLEYKNQFFVKRLPLKRCLKFFNKDYGVTWTAMKDEDGGTLEIKQVNDDGDTVVELDIPRFSDYEDESKSMYSMGYLENMLRGNKLLSAAEDEVLVKHDDDFPMSISFEDGEIMYEFILAPRIEEE